jgi:radical SAM protein with 4Fe4S-binding SPASM domain
MNIRGMEGAYTASHERLTRFLQLKKEMKAKTIVILSMIDFFPNSRSIESRREYWESMEGIDSFLPKEFITWDGSCKEINRLDEENKGGRKPEKSSTVTCTFPFERMTITWDGTVVPCCFDFNNKYVCGDLNTQSLREIWTGSKMKSLRREFRENRVTNPLCRNCEKLYEPSEKK